jgi:Domain of unknown function (DUF4386)
MEPTAEQRAYARLAGVCFLANYVLQGLGDSVTILLRGGETFAERARYAVGHELLWRVSLLEVGLAWVSIGILAFALYAVLEPVDRRLAQLALCLRLGASFVGGASLMFRVAHARLLMASATEGLFTPEQLGALASTMTRGGSEGVELAWMFQGAGSVLFFLLFLRSRYLPGALARLGILGSALVVAVSIAMFIYPQYRTSRYWPAASPPPAANAGTRSTSPATANAPTSSPPPSGTTPSSSTSACRASTV